MNAHAATTSTAWCSVDETFFRLVARLFPPHFVDGAGALLCSYDDDDEAAPAEPQSRTAAAVPSRQPALL